MRGSDLELRLLRMFVTLAEELHYGRAAQRLFMTQPPLSKAIQQLEAIIGLRLFERDSKHVALTPAGDLLLEKAREALLHVHDTVELGKAVARGMSGRITVGFTGAMLYRGLPKMVDWFKANSPGVELALHEAMSQRQVELVRSGSLDAGFVNSPLAPSGVDSMMVFRERFMACVPIGHKLAKSARIKLQAMRHETFLSFSRATSPAYHDRVMALCADAGFHPATRQFEGQILTMVAMVAAGFGVALIPESVKGAGINGAVFIPIVASVPQPTAFFIWKAAPVPPALSGLVKAVRAIRSADCRD